MHSPLYSKSVRTVSTLNSCERRSQAYLEANVCVAMRSHPSIQECIIEVFIVYGIPEWYRDPDQNQTMKQHSSDPQLLHDLQRLESRASRV